MGHNLLTPIYYPLSAFPTLSHTTLPFTVASRASWGRKPPETAATSSFGPYTLKPQPLNMLALPLLWPVESGGRDVLGLPS